MIERTRRLLRLAPRMAPTLAAALIAGMAVWLAGRMDGHTGLLDYLLLAGVAAIVLAYPLARRVVSVPVTAAIRIPGFESPDSVPRRKSAVSLVTSLVPAVVVLTLAISNRSAVPAGMTDADPVVLGGEVSSAGQWEWLCLALVILAGLTEIMIVLHAWRVVRRVRADVPGLKAALADADVRFAIYTTRGASHRSAYQLQAWLSELQRSGQRGVVIVRDTTAVAEYAAVTDWPIVLCPRTADLEIVTAPSIRAVFYLNQVARNTDMVAWRGPRHIYLGHGDSNKMLSSHPAHAMYDEIWVAGQHSIDRYRAAGVVIEPSKFVIIGRPQLAALGDSIGSGGGGEVDSSSNPRIALYAPTWHGYNSLTQLSSLPRGVQIVDELVAAGLQVIFRPHPMSALTRAGRAQIAAIRSRLQTTTPQPKTFVAAAAEADLLVADASSVIVDFLATGRPVIAILPTPAAASQVAGQGGSALDDAVLGIDGRVLPGLYRVDSSLQGLPGAIADAMGQDPLRDARLAIRDELFGDAAKSGWTTQWDEQLARVLD